MFQTAFVVLHQAMQIIGSVKSYKRNQTGSYTMYRNNCMLSIYEIQYNILNTKAIGPRLG